MMWLTPDFSLKAIEAERYPKIITKIKTKWNPQTKILSGNISIFVVGDQTG